ncbi:MAG: dipeptidase [Candidatus Hodarchaeota archaeon]
MGKNKKYDGYKAYQYLTPGIDYKEYKFRKAIKEEWAFAVPLSKSEEERVEEILEKNIVIDLHEHPTLMPVNYQECVEHWSEGREFMAYEALSYSGLDAVFDNMMNGSATITSKHGWKWSDTIYDLGQRLCDIAQQNFAIHCKKVDDIITAFNTGRLAWVAVLESASSIENEVDRIDILYGLGIRAMGLCYSESNMLGSGLKEIRDSGLSDFGYDAIMRMNKVKMLIDISHVSDQTALDAIEASKKPIMISHAGARALLPIRRLFPDEVLQALAERNGIIGIEAAPGYTATKDTPIPTIDTYMEHLEYCINLMGIDHVGCGPDTLYGDHVGFYRLMEERQKKAGLGHYIRPGFIGDGSNIEALPDYVLGMENPTECLHNVTRWLIKHGYSDHEITKIIGGNALRLLKQVW